MVILREIDGGGATPADPRRSRPGSKPRPAGSGDGCRYFIDWSASSGYACMPNSGRSSPSTSDSGGTRIDFTAFTALKTTKVRPNAHTAQIVAPINWTTNCLESP